MNRKCRNRGFLLIFFIVFNVFWAINLNIDTPDVTTINYSPYVKRFKEKNGVVQDNEYVTIQNGAQELLPVSQTVANDKWIGVDKGIYVFSAYFSKQDNLVRVIGAALRTRHHHVTCNISDDRHWKTFKTSLAKLVLFPKRGYRYAPTVLECPVLPNFNPKFVSMVTGENGTVASILRVKTSDPPAAYERTFTICLKPLNFNYSRAYELVEWIELNRNLGAEKFVVYNYSSASNVGRILEFYSRLGLVDVVQWDIPLVVNTWPNRTVPEIASFGQIAALHDCLYKSRPLSKYIVHVDVDEFIMPRDPSTNTWFEMLNKFDNNTAAFIFRNTFFRKEWNNTAVSFPRKNEALRFKLITLLKTRHEKLIFPHGKRSKFITRTASAEHLEIHTVLKADGNVNKIPIDVGLLHHYRNWLKYDDAEDNKVEDNTVIEKFAPLLINNVAKVWKKLPGVADV